jgi:ketosteroid isomerase-like protein
MTTASPADTLALATRFFAAVTAGDIETVRACYAPDAVIWHNTDGATQTVDENLVVLGWIAKNVTNFRYEDVRLQSTSTGFVEQHLTCGTSPGGKPFAIPACIICTVVDGRVTRVDEYLDSAQTAAIAQ